MDSDFIRFKIPNALIGILQILHFHGFEVCIVGGVVRDMLCRILHNQNSANKYLSSKLCIEKKILNKSHQDMQNVSHKKNILHKNIGFMPKDWDIATSATPKEVLDIFESYKEYFKIIPIGIEHGTLRILPLFASDVGLVEITTYRIDGKYSDRRRPDEVIFTASMKEDLARRDFSMNAIALLFDSILENSSNSMNSVCKSGLQKDSIMVQDEKSNHILMDFVSQDFSLDSIKDIFTQDYFEIDMQICDYYHGIDSIKHREIACVGSADIRFMEDGIRIMRALRFGATLQPQFSISENTKQSIITCRHNLAHISKERILHEYNLMLLGGHIAQIGLDYRIVLEIIYPAIAAISPYQYHVNMLALKHAPSILNVRLAIFFYSLESKLVLEALKDVRYDSKSLRDMSKILVLQDRGLPVSRLEIKERLGFASEEIFKQYLQVLMAQALAFKDMQNIKLDVSIESSLKDKSSLSKTYDIAQVKYVESMIYDIIKNDECFLISHLPVNGDDMLSLLDKSGISDKAMIGKLLQGLLDYAMRQNLARKQTSHKDSLPDRYISTRDMLLHRAREMINFIKT